MRQIIKKGKQLLPAQCFPSMFILNDFHNHAPPHDVTSKRRKCSSPSKKTPISLPKMGVKSFHGESDIWNDDLLFGNPAVRFGGPVGFAPPDHARFALVTRGQSH
jgi:hypothetical protein